MLKRLKLAYPLLNESQLLRDKHLQPGAHRRAFFGSKVADQNLEVSQRKTQSTSAADERQPIHIDTRVLSVACVRGAGGSTPISS
jgi:hypothetical protein